MKTMLAGYVLIVISLIFPLSLNAHAGVSKISGNAIIFLTQSPLSPLVGEKVAFSFRLTDSSYKPLAYKYVKLSVIDTYEGDESKDTTISSQTYQTDINGDFTFAYAFPRQNYFDIDLEFADPQTGKRQNTGFLVQTRAKYPLNLFKTLGIALGAALLGTVLLRKKTKKQN